MSDLFKYIYEEKGCDRADLLCGEKYGFIRVKIKDYDVLFDSNFGCLHIKLYIDSKSLHNGIVRVNCLCKQGVYYNYQMGKITKFYDVTYGKKFIIIYYNYYENGYNHNVKICSNYKNQKINYMEIKINTIYKISYIFRDCGNGIFKYN